MPPTVDTVMLQLVCIVLFASDRPALCAISSKTKTKSWNEQSFIANHYTVNDNLLTPILSIINGWYITKMPCSI